MSWAGISRSGWNRTTPDSCQTDSFLQHWRIRLHYGPGNIWQGRAAMFKGAWIFIAGEIPVSFPKKYLCKTITDLVRKVFFKKGFLYTCNSTFGHNYLLYGMVIFIEKISCLFFDHLYQSSLKRQQPLKASINGQLFLKFL